MSTILQGKKQLEQKLQASLPDVVQFLAVGMKIEAAVSVCPCIQIEYCGSRTSYTQLTCRPLPLHHAKLHDTYMLLFACSPKP